MTQTTRVALALLINHLSLSLIAIEPYHPVQPIPLAESWRWHAQEALERLALSTCLEGRNGELWFVDEESLVRYDGASLETFPAPDDLNLIPCRAAVMTDDGSIYLLLPGQIMQFQDGTYREVYRFSGRYDMRGGRAQLIDGDTVLFGTPDGIVAVRDEQARVINTFHRRASYLLMDSHGDLWVNRVGTGLVFRYRDFSLANPILDAQWERFRILPDYGDHLSLMELPDGSLWCANDNPSHGLQGFDRQRNQWKPLPIDVDAEEKVHYSIDISPDGTAVIYGDKRILLYKDGRSRELTFDDFTFPSTSPFVCSLSNGSMIIGGRRESVYLVDCSSDWWQTYEGLNYYCTDPDDRQWFITFEGDVVRHDPASGEWLCYTSQDGLINTPLVLICTGDGKVWAAGRHDNIAALSIFTDGQWQLFMHPELGTRISHQSVFETRDGAVLLGSGDTHSENLPGRGGLLKYEVNGNRYTTTHYAPPRVPFRIVGIDEGPDGTFWIGGSSLSRMKDFNAETLPALGQFVNSWTDSFLVTERGDLWVAQWGVGIHVFDGQQWTYSGDYQTDLVRGVVFLHEDQIIRDQVWAATSAGLFNFGLDHWVEEPVSRGLAILREGGGIHQSPGGTLWLNASSRNWHFRGTGRMPGRERFEPEFRTIAFKRYDTFPETRITEYEARVHEPGLSHFQWAGNCQWSFAQTEELSYSYRIDGGAWTPFSSRTEVVLETETNGDHVFEVRARTPYGQIDPTPATVTFRVIPVLWKQPWFILTTLAVVMVLIILIVVIVRQRIQHLLSLEEYKIQFFTNISHELRTPLMVILGPLESLLKEVDDKGRRHLEIAYRNARKLVGLLDRLLDFRKAELGKIQTRTQALDLVLFVRQEMETLRPLAERKGQKLNFEADRDDLVTRFDPKLAEVILDNLLTNAIKYTPQNGAIRVNLRTLEASADAIRIRLEVEDTGPGIPRRELEKVFDPFYQIGGKHGVKSHSTGIGLAHTKSMVKALGGTIRAESPVNRQSIDAPGTRFVMSIKLPLASESEAAPVARRAAAGMDVALSDEAAGGEDLPLMLIVEDDDDIREFLQIELSSAFSILLADNGVIGLEIARERIPDIVVSDILMPQMDGRELCRQLKEDQRTSHIPVILLTALKSETNELAGLEAGADDYITKPVNVALMRKRLDNILMNRRKVREFIVGHTRSIAISKEELPVNKVDKEFMARFIGTIEENLTNENFDVEDLAKRLFMSRMTLYRKVKALTGQSPGVIIRTIRLKKAAQYLETGAWSVSQVIEQVGFLDLSHFSRSFKKEYGCTPSEYIEQYSTRPADDGEASGTSH